MAEEAQPPAGQGDGGAGGLYDSYLQFVPPDQREAAQAHLAEVSKSVNTRLEEAANLRQTYEPYQQIEGLNLYQPEELQELVSWHQNITANPDTFRDWLTAAAQESGLSVAEAQALEDAAASPPDELANLQQAFEQQLSQRDEQIQQLANTQFVSAESALISDRFSQLESENGVELTKEQRDLIVELGLSAMPEDGMSLVAGNDWIGAGWDRFKDVYAQAQVAFVNDKAAAPPPALAAGGTPQAQLPTSWEEAKARAAERLRQARA